MAHHADKIVGRFHREAPQLARNLERSAADAQRTLRKLPGTLDNVNDLTVSVNRSLGKVNPLLDKANAIEEAKV